MDSYRSWWMFTLSVFLLVNSVALFFARNELLSIKREAVDRGHAEWVTDGADIQFVWKSN